MFTRLSGRRAVTWPPVGSTLAIDGTVRLGVSATAKGRVVAVGKIDEGDLVVADIDLPLGSKPT